MALAVVEGLARGLPERVAYNRAEYRVRERGRDDYLCGLTGDVDLRHVRVDNGHADRRVDPWAKDSSCRRLTPGDWRALRRFLGRACPDANGRTTNAGRQLLEGVLCDRRTHREVADTLGLTEAASAVARSRAIAACEYALGRRERRSYDRRRRAGR